MGSALIKEGSLSRFGHEHHKFAVENNLTNNLGLVHQDNS